MTEKDYAPLSKACVQGLCDKIYERKKIAGVEVEKMVKDFSDANNTSQIKRLIRVLGQEGQLMASSNPYVKNGALMGLSSIAVGLGMGCEPYLPLLLAPIAACAAESESRVRYGAAEALFNVVKIARGAILPHFPLVFDALARLAADSEPQVRQGAELLDRLVKDIVTESGGLELSALGGLLRERVFARGGAARQFVLSWVGVLDAVPGLALLQQLPHLLDGLFRMLDDASPEIRRMCDVQLNEFLRSIKKAPAQADFSAMINVLITHAQSPEELVQLTALTWIKEFVELSGAALLPAAGGVLAAALPCLAYADDTRKNIREVASTVNFQLSKLVTESATDGDASADGPATADGPASADGPAPADGPALKAEGCVEVLARLLRHPALDTRAAALDWILTLYTHMPQEMKSQSPTVFAAALGCVPDGADDVARRGLAVLAEICSCTADTPGDLESSPYYHKFLKALIRMLAADENLLEDRGAFIIRQVCTLLNAEEVYCALARLLRDERELRVAAALVDVLGAMLLTAAELYDLRHQLRRFDAPATVSLFRTLYSCWCHSPVALLALCLLTHNYHHCNTLIATFGDLEITVEFLTEVDKLVQLIESPIFAYLRLELVGGGASCLRLRAALYGILMLLPQGAAFHALRARLQCAPPPAPAPAPPHGGQGDDDRLVGGCPEHELVEEFLRVQAAHRRYRLAAPLGRP